VGKRPDIPGILQVQPFLGTVPAAPGGRFRAAAPAGRRTVVGGRPMSRHRFKIVLAIEMLSKYSSIYV
jgi:hypothetical protein